MNSSTRIIDLTVADLEQLITTMVEKAMGNRQEQEPTTVSGIDGIAKLYGCSKSTAMRIKKSGMIDDAIFQVGRTILVDVKKAKELKPIKNLNK